MEKNGALSLFRCYEKLLKQKNNIRNRKWNFYLVNKQTLYVNKK